MNLLGSLNLLREEKQRRGNEERVNENNSNNDNVLGKNMFSSERSRYFWLILSGNSWHISLSAHSLWGGQFFGKPLLFVSKKRRSPRLKGTTFVNICKQYSKGFDAMFLVAKNKNCHINFFKIKSNEVWRNSNWYRKSYREISGC